MLLRDTEIARWYLAIFTFTICSGGDTSSSPSRFLATTPSPALARSLRSVHQAALKMQPDLVQQRTLTADG